MASEWDEVRLGAHVSHQKGFAFKSKDYEVEGHPIVRVSNFTNRSIDLTSCNYIAHEKVSSYEAVKIRFQDVVIATVGSWPANPASVVGKAIQVPVEANNSLLNQNAVRLRAKDTIDQRFLFFLLKSDAYQGFIVSTAQGSANQASITLKSIFDFQFELPPLPEQKAIAHMLGSLDDRIELNRRMNGTLEAMAQALFKSWFVDFDPVIDNALAAGKEIPAELNEKAQARAALGDKRQPLPEEIRTLFPDEFACSDELGWIPKGWVVKQVGELLELAYGKSLPAKKREAGPYPVYGSGGIAGFHNRAIVEGPGIIVGRKGTVGSVFWEPGEFFPIDTVFFVKPIIDMPLYWIYQNLQNMDIASLGADSAVPGVNRNAVYIKEWVLPDRSVLGKYWNQLSTPLLKRKSLDREIETLVLLRDTLLPKLLSGEIRIPDAEKMVEELAL